MLLARLVARQELFNVPGLLINNYDWERSPYASVTRQREVYRRFWVQH